MAFFQSSKEGLGRVLLRFHHLPAAEEVPRSEVGVIRGAKRQAVAFFGKSVEVPMPAAPVCFDLAGMIVDLHSVGSVDAAGISEVQPTPFGVRDDDKSACVPRAAGDIRAAFHAVHGHEVRGISMREVSRQAHGHDVPEVTILHGAGVKFRTEERCEGLGPETLRPSDGVVIEPDEMVGERKEIIPLLSIAAAHYFDR